MFYDTCRRLDPDTMRMLLPNNETIQEECISLETFSNQVIAAGISKNSSRGSVNLGIPFGNGQYGSKMSGHLECWFKPYLQVSLLICIYIYNISNLLVASWGYPKGFLLVITIHLRKSLGS